MQGGVIVCMYVCMYDMYAFRHQSVSRQRSHGASEDNPPHPPSLVVHSQLVCSRFVYISVGLFHCRPPLTEWVCSLRRTSYPAKTLGSIPWRGRETDRFFLGLFFCLEGQVVFLSRGTGYFCLFFLSRGIGFLGLFVRLEGQVFFLFLSSRLSQLLCRPVCA